MNARTKSAIDESSKVLTLGKSPAYPIKRVPAILLACIIEGTHPMFCKLMPDDLNSTKGSIMSGRNVAGMKIAGLMSVRWAR